MAKTERLCSFMGMMPKEHKTSTIAKTACLLEVMPQHADTDMDAVLKACKSLEMDGLLWGAHEIEEVGYGIKKLELLCVVEDDKVSIYDLQHRIQKEHKNLIQTVDVAAMNKV